VLSGRDGEFHAMTRLLDLSFPYPLRKSDAVRLVNATNGRR
jgi:hypothetical protein